jgi:SsrA-binding protein
MAKNPQKKENKGPATIANRRAGHDYEFVDTLEAGVVLMGSEVKSIFKGRANLTDAYCTIRNGELWMINADVEPYSHASHFAHDRRRDRKLLMHKKEILQLDRKVMEKGFSLIVSKMYFKKGKVKVSVSLARGKKQHDKRETLKEKDSQRELARALSERD